MSNLTSSIALPAVLLQAQAQSVANALVKSLTEQLSQEGEALLDAKALSQFDSSALAVILACHRAVLAKGAQLRVTGLPERAKALAQVYGLSALLH